MFEVKTGFYVIIFLLDHHNNALIVYLYTCRSAHLNMNGRMREQECIKRLTSKICMGLPTICFPREVAKG